MEMSTCEEPRAPNGPSPIATASGQRSVRSKMVWNYIKQINCKFSEVYMVAACHSHLLQNFFFIACVQSSVGIMELSRSKPGENMGTRYGACKVRFIGGAIFTDIY